MCVCVWCVCVVCVCMHACLNQVINISSLPLPSPLHPLFFPTPLRKLATGQMSVPSRVHKSTNLKGLRFNLTTHNKYARNFVCSQARKMVRNFHCVAMATLLFIHRWLLPLVAWCNVSITEGLIIRCQPSYQSMSRNLKYACALVRANKMADSCTSSINT